MEQTQPKKANRRIRRLAERQEKKAALNDESFKEGIRQTVRCSGAVTTEEIYKGVVNAIASGHAELAIVSETEGLNYFTNLNLMPLHNVISEASEKAAEEFNKAVDAEISRLKDAN